MPKGLAELFSVGEIQPRKLPLPLPRRKVVSTSRLDLIVKPTEINTFAIDRYTSQPPPLVQAHALVNRTRRNTPLTPVSIVLAGRSLAQVPSCIIHPIVIDVIDNIPLPRLNNIPVHLHH